MNRPDRVERQIAGWLVDAAQPRTPDYFQDILAQTARTRQRPAWSFPERWLPVTVLARERVAWRPLNLRTFAIIALLLALLLAALYAVGSRQRLPAPFGPAANGLIAYARNGDIYTVDPQTGVTRAVITGPTLDLQPRWSRDGSRFVFERKLTDEVGPGQLYVALADGSELTLITPTPLAILDSENHSYAFSPDGREVMVVSSVVGRSTISFARTDGTGVRALDLGMDAYTPSFRPPNGTEIVFVGRDGPAETTSNGLYVINADGSNPRTLVAPTPDLDLGLPAWSPDGSRIAFAMWETTTDDLTARIHVIDAVGSRDRPLPLPAAWRWQGVPAWSNDGTRIMTVGGRTPTMDTALAAVVQADGSGSSVEMEHPVMTNGGCCSLMEWSPDDKIVLATFVDSVGRPLQQTLWDPATGRALPVPWASLSDPSWQRLGR